MMKKQKRIPKANGRPLTIIDQIQFEKLCGIQCTLAEISSYFDVDDQTIDDWCKRTYNKGFSEAFKAKRGLGKVSLRRKQYEMAISGDKVLLIWLGKQYLGQADKVEQYNNVLPTSTTITFMNNDEKIVLGAKLKLEVDAQSEKDVSEEPKELCESNS